MNYDAAYMVYQKFSSCRLHDYLKASILDPISNGHTVVKLPL